MKMRFVLYAALVALAVFSVSCASPDSNNQNQGAGATALPTTSVQEGAATESTVTAGDSALTPTGSAENTTPEGSTPEGTTPEGGTPAPETGGTAVIPQTGLGSAGLPDNLDDVLLVLRETGATVNLGETVDSDEISVPGQSILINGEEVQIFTYDSAEALEMQASQLGNEPGSEEEPQFYKLGTMLVRYVGSDPGVRDLLEDVLGAQAAGQ